MQDAAKAELIEITDYLTRNAPWYAERVIQDIKTRVCSLCDFPYRGKPASLPILSNSEIRVIALSRYILYYRVFEDKSEVHIYHVIHSAQSDAAILRRFKQDMEE
ncbi:MAG: type II toxin-antitoxin system RelE/ParE family toxin [Oscillospiraceae bacterium]|jgi:plasmid stabilization system protein ParE|nr:type II toxin-antitoxin system RelE/ParE family toxin [Oscillospiraceae bacterium]